MTRKTDAELYAKWAEIDERLRPYGDDASLAKLRGWRDALGWVLGDWTIAQIEADNEIAACKAKAYRERVKAIRDLAAVARGETYFPFPDLDKGDDGADDAPVADYGFKHRGLTDE